jgi:translation elongation factor EF-Ts
MSRNLVSEEIQLIKRLRTHFDGSASMAICKEAVQKVGLNFEKCEAYIIDNNGSQTRVIGSESKVGVIRSYVHHTNKIGVLVELAVATDFAAKSIQLIDFADGLAMQIASMTPTPCCFTELLSADSVFTPGKTVEHIRNMVQNVLKENVVIVGWSWRQAGGLWTSVKE